MTQKYYKHGFFELAKQPDHPLRQMRGKSTSDSAQSRPPSQMRGKSTSDSAQSRPLRQMRGKSTSDSTQSEPLSQKRGKSTSDSAQSGPLRQMRGKSTSDSAQSRPPSQMRGKSTSDSAQSGPPSQMRGKVPLIPPKQVFAWGLLQPPIRSKEPSPVAHMMRLSLVPQRMIREIVNHKKAGSDNRKPVFFDRSIHDIRNTRPIQICIASQKSRFPVSLYVWA
ncbi:hypothetical protein [Paenibacillus jilunlii]|uniref:hypothetical protein n=1 Tax=Paenibacillus jilunlii TaxID=682956 RepID=UPI0013D384FC|nr:hypothetical protein [Paenibacillus jilunlii]